MDADGKGGEGGGACRKSQIKSKAFHTPDLTLAHYGDLDRLAQIGLDGKAWMERFHGKAETANTQLEIY